jgi:hypothetical protein
MSNTPQSIESIADILLNFCENDIRKVQDYMEYLVARRSRQEPQVSMTELRLQNNEATDLMLTIILQRGHLISMVNHLANIIVQNENMKSEDKLEAQKAVNKANSLLDHRNTSDSE